MDHFNSPVKSRAEADLDLMCLREKLKETEDRSHNNEEDMIDLPFIAEVAGFVCRHKYCKAAGPYGFEEEHLKNEGAVRCVYISAGQSTRARKRPTI